MSRMLRTRAEVPGTVVMDYVLREVGSPAQLILLLHGFRDSGQRLFDSLAGSCPKDAVVLAPNAPFPLPERKPLGGFSLGFSWYFYDSRSGEYFIGPGAAARALGELVRKLGFEGLPKRVVGFSQGGYLAGVAALELGGVRQVVGVASECLHEEMRERARELGLAWPPAFRVDAIHGDKDDVVSLADSEASHKALLASGLQGEFRVLAGIGHRIPPEARLAVKEMLLY